MAYKGAISYKTIELQGPASSILRSVNKTYSKYSSGKEFPGFRMHPFVINILLLLLTSTSLVHTQAQSQPQSSDLGHSSTPIQEADTFMEMLLSAQTVGQLAQILEESETEANDMTANASTIYTAPSSNRYLAARSPVENIAGRNLNAFFNDTKTGFGGYNLTIPGCLSLNETLIGEIESPNGTIIANATLADLVTVLQLNGPQLWNYTMTFANQTYNTINASLDLIICEGAQGATRDLLWDPPYLEQSEGFWTAFIISVSGLTGMAFGSLSLGVIKEGGHQEIEVGILAAAAGLEFLFVTLMFRLQTRHQFLGKLEAYILNGFIWIAAQFVKLCDAVWNSRCCGSVTASEAFKAFKSNLPQWFTTGANSMVQSLSTTNLLGLGGDQGGASSDNIEAQGGGAGAGTEVGLSQVVVEAAAGVVAQIAELNSQGADQVVAAQMAGSSSDQTCGQT